jgi:hypothetical protein
MRTQNTMSHYEYNALQELARWQKKMKQRPSLFNKLSKGLQTRVNKIIHLGLQTDQRTLVWRVWPFISNMSEIRAGSI